MERKVTHNRTLDLIKNGYDNSIDFLEAKKLRLISAAAGTALAITALAGCSADIAADPPKPSTSSSEAPTPSETAEPTTVTPNEYTDEQIVDMYNEPMPENLKQYETMSVADYEALPIEDRLAFNSYLTRDQDYLETLWYEAYDDNPSYLIEDTIDKDSTAIQVVASAAYFASNTFAAHFGGYGYDRDTAQKILASGFYDASTETNSAYKFWTDERDKSTNSFTPTVLAGYGSLQMPQSIDGEKTSTNITTDDGKEYLARTISLTAADGNHTEETYILVPFTNYKGEQKQAYVLYAN